MALQTLHIHTIKNNKIDKFEQNIFSDGKRETILVVKH